MLSFGIANLALLAFYVSSISAMLQQRSSNEAPCSSPPCSNSPPSFPVEYDNNKFALLFQQMLARQREINDLNCQSFEDCPEGFDCFSGKCQTTSGPRRTKMINLYSRW